MKARTRDRARRAEAPAQPPVAAMRVITGMFRDEIRLGRLCSHPNLVATLDSGEEDGNPTRSWNTSTGSSLARARDTLRARGERFTRAQAVQISIEICKGLVYLHAHDRRVRQALGVVHRDVTPPNVLLGSDGHVKLCDLGFAKSALQTTLTEPGLIKGKFSYLSPEAALEQPIDQRADLFARRRSCCGRCSRCGVCSTRRPTTRRSSSSSGPRFRRSRRSRPTPTTVLEEIVMKCLARDPNGRFSNGRGAARGAARVRRLARAELRSGRVGPVAEASAGGGSGAGACRRGCVRLEVGRRLQ